MASKQLPGGTDWTREGRISCCMSSTGRKMRHMVDQQPQGWEKIFENQKEAQGIKENTLRLSPASPQDTEEMTKKITQLRT